MFQGRQKEGLRFFSSDCRQHNPFVSGGMGALFDAMTAAQEGAPGYSDPHFAIKRVLAEGDMVAVHTELLYSKSKPGKGGLRQVHLFRFDRRDKIVKYCDITQEVQAGMPSSANAF